MAGPPIERQDLTLIGPLVVAILTACAVLVVDLIRPGRKPLALTITISDWPSRPR